MKITLERLREIVTEEVVKEAVSPEDAQRTIVALLQGTPPNVTGDIMGAVYDEMYDADVSEPSPEPEEEEFPTEYQPGGGEGDRPVMGFRESLIEIINEEISKVLNEDHGEFSEGLAPDRQIAAMRAQIGDMSYEIEKMLIALLKAGYSQEDIINMAIQLKKMDPHPEDVQVAENIVQEEYYLYKIEQYLNTELLTEVRSMSIEDAREIMGKLDADPNDPAISREDAWDAKMTVREYEQGEYTDPAELRQQAMSMTDAIITSPMRRTTRQIKQLEDMWRKYKGDLRSAIETIQADNNEEHTIVDALASFYNYLTSTGNIQQHDVS